MIKTTIQFEDGTTTDSLISLQKQIGLLATDHSARWLNITLRPDMSIEFVMDSSFVLDLDTHAMAEWHNYVLEGLDQIGEAAPDAMDQFLQTAFLHADAEKFTQASKNLGLKIGQVLEQNAGLIIGDGPEDVASINIYAKLAHAMLSYTPSIQQRYADNASAYEGDVSAATDQPSFQTI